jgi:hypothetical protein
VRQHLLYDVQTGPYKGTTNSKRAMASSIYLIFVSACTAEH